MWYCSREHQRSHWKAHKGECRRGKTATGASGGGAAGGRADTTYSRLREAATTGDLEAARGLLQSPSLNVNAYDADGATLAYIAAAHGHTAMVELLADEGGADISKGTRDDSKVLLNEAWRLNPPPQEVQDEPHGGACPLWIAAWNGRVATVRALLERGADVNQTKVNGGAPLIAAAWSVG